MKITPQSDEHSLQIIKADMYQKRYKDAQIKTEDLLQNSPDYIPAIVIQAQLLLVHKLDNYKQLCKDACVKASKLLEFHFELLKLSSVQDLTNFVVENKEILQTLKSVCSSLNEWDIITSCFESAYHVEFDIDLKKELLTELFECYTHQYALNKQGKIALKLYSLTQSKEHFMWTICSIRLEALATKDPVRAEKLIDQAKNIIYAHLIRELPLGKEEAFFICFSVLEQAKEFSNAITYLKIFLEHDRVSKFNGNRMLGRLLACSQSYKEAAEEFQNLLTCSPDDWECFQYYLSCLLEDDSTWSCGTINQIHPPKKVDRLHYLSDEVFDSCMETASDFVRGLISRPDIVNTSIRSPYLALVEIQRRKFLRGRSDVDALINALSEYFTRFGHLACCVLDAESSLQVLTKEQILVLVKSFKSEVPMTTDDVVILAKQITIFKLQELCELSLDELESNVVSMTNLFTQSLSLSENLDFKKYMNVEDLLSLASNALVRLFWRTQHLGYLFEAILILEFGLTVRRCIPQFKILLVHLYSHLGAYKLAYDRYKSLGIKKTLLLETCSHHILPQMLRSPFLNYASDLLQEYLSSMEHIFLESANSAIFAYRRCSYSNIFAKFLLKDQLQRSQKYLMTTLEGNILQLKHKAGKIEDIECVLQNMNNGSQLQALSSDEILESLTVNDDMQTRPWWSPTPDLNYLLEPFQQNSICSPLEDKNQIIKIKALIPRLIRLSLCSDGRSSKSMFRLLADFGTLIGIMDAKIFIKGFSTGDTTLEEVNCSVNSLCFAVFLNAQKLGSWSEVDSMFRRFTDEGITISEPAVFISYFLQMITEPLSWHCLVIQSFIRSLLPSRKKKKKKDNPAEQAISASIDSLCWTIEIITKGLRELDINFSRNLDTIFPLLLDTSSSGPGMAYGVLRNFFTSLDADKSLDEEWDEEWDEERVITGVQESLHATSSEFHDICNKKVALLKKLKKQLK